jgi:hypothetical protein
MHVGGSSYAEIAMTLGKGLKRKDISKGGLVTKSIRLN